MMRAAQTFLLATTFLLVSLATSGVQAEPVDLSKLKCKEFVEMVPEKMTLIVTWFVGFNTEEDDDPVVDFDMIKTQVEKVRAFCVQNPDFALKPAADNILQ